jgi:hypothetical protein
MADSRLSGGLTMNKLRGPHTNREWIEYIVATVLLLLVLAVAVYEFELLSV